MTQDAGERDYSALLKKALLEIRALKADLGRERSRTSAAIAVVGMGCRFPGGADAPASYWPLLRDAADVIGDAPADRWDKGADYGPDHADPATIHTRRGGFLERLDAFDPAFFDLSTSEAAGMDPQQRLLLEVAWEAFENAGIPPAQAAGSRTAVFVGITNEADYHKALIGPPPRGGTGISNAVAANRLSFVFDLKGPSVAVDTACSSALVAVHLACRSLRAGDCDLAIAAGVNAILSPEWMVAFSMAGMISASGACRSFDAAADGFVRSEGCGALLLKRLEDARRDGDRVLAIVRGTAVGQNGRGSALTVPHGAALQAVVRAAVEDAGIAPRAIGYVEAHGLGSELGDPIEVAAIQAALAPGRAPADRCVIGSAKASMGHSEAASGMAALIKTILVFRHGTIPPQRHLTRLNPLLALEGTPFSIPKAPVPWPAGPEARIACVNSFGLGGSVANVVLEAPPAAGTPAGDPGNAAPAEVMVLSARTAAALEAMTRRYGAWLDRNPDVTLRDVAATAATGRAQFHHRLALVVRDRTALCAALGRFAAGDRAAVLHAARTPDAAPPRVAVLFGDAPPGPADASPGGDAGLPVLPASFGAAHDRAAARYRAIAGEDLQPARAGAWRVALQFAWLELLRGLGLIPHTVIGDGIGEVSAALAAGACDLDAALHLAAARDRAAAGRHDAAAAIAGLTFQPPRRTWISGWSGALMSPHKAPGADHWRRLLEGPPGRRDPGAAASIGCDLILAIGGEGAEAHRIDPALADPAERREVFLRALATLFVRGTALDWRVVYPRAGAAVELPTYPFQRIRCWPDATAIRSWSR